LNLGEFVDEKPVADKTEKKEKKLGAGAVLNAAAYPISAAVGSYVLVKDVHHESYERLRDSVFSELREKNINKLIGARDGKNPSEEIAKIRQGFDNERAAIFEKMGFTSLKRHFDNLPIPYKNKVVINALTASGITLGALLLVANSKNVFNELLGNGEDNGKSR
jgi:hypothetical protein